MRYKLKQDLPHNSATCQADLLHARGIEDTAYYMNPGLEAVYDPMLLENIMTGAHCLLDHLKANHNIFIQIDSDQDGYTSAAIMYLYIKKIYPEANIKWRVHEGKQHGVIPDTVPDDTHLVIIPDAGSNQIEEHAELKARNIDVIVIDHHIAEEISPHAIIINNQTSPSYPNKSLCGAGMVYKFCQLLDAILEVNYADDFIDLVAIGLVGDMMDLRNFETRYLVKIGLRNIQNVGLQTLIDKQSYSIGNINSITPTDIAFYITPLVNAIVRVGTQTEKETMFIAFIDGYRDMPSTKRGAKAGDTETAAGQTARVATNARNRQNRLKEKAIEMLEYKIAKYDLLNNQIIVIQLEEDEEIESTLTGLIAMQLMNKYRKPVILVRKNEDGFYKGSARGDNNSELDHLKDFFQASGFFEYVEGHQSAHGLSIHEDNIDNFISYANEMLKDVSFDDNVYMVDYIFDANEYFADIILTLGGLQSIWGQGVEEPRVVVTKIPLNSSNISFIGTNKDTVKFTYHDVTFIKFKSQEFKEKLSQFRTFDLTILGRCNVNEWAGEMTPQVIIEDYNLTDTSSQF